MDNARVASLDRLVPSSEYEKLPPDLRRTYVESLTCPGCGQPAYFIRRSRIGRSACFGARPHLDGCELASPTSGSEETPVTADDEFVLRPVEPGVERQDEVADPGYRSTGEGSTAAATERAASGRPAAAARMGLNSLLKRLIRDPEFRHSDATLVLPDEVRGPVRTLCVQAAAADVRWHNRKKLYWGTIRYARQDSTGGAWLNLGRPGSASLHLAPDIVTMLLERHDAVDIDELQGATFVGYLPLRKSAKTDRLFLFVEDLQWFALRMPDEDPF